MGRQLTTLKTISEDHSQESVAASRVTTSTVHVPGFAKTATFYLNLTTISGASKSADFAVSYVDPVDKTTTVAYPGSGITQVTAAGLVVVHLTPYTADDDVAPIYTLNGPLPGTLSWTLTLGTSSVQEVQTIDLGDIGAADTYKLTYNAVESTNLITYAADSTTAIQAALDEVMSGAHCVVARVDANTYTVTFNHGFAPAGLISVTTVTGFTPKGDAGYANGVIQTTPDTAGDEVYAGSLSILMNAA